MKLWSPLFSKTEVNRGACPGQKKKKKTQATSYKRWQAKEATHGIQVGMVAATDWISSDLPNGTRSNFSMLLVFRIC
jgi:hypothetical protein